MKEITLEELLEAGCHFGHQVTRQNPKARDYVFEARDNIHIIDLALTKQGLEEAAEYLKNLATINGTLIVVGSKKQAQPIILKEVKRVKDELALKKVSDNIFMVTNRWIGGTLTNVEEVKKNYQKLHDLKTRLKDEFERVHFTKKELGLMDKERQKLEMFYGGIADLKVKADALFIVDTHLENLAVMEAHKTNTKAVGIVDTNADPTFIDYVIPANDDAVGSIELIVKYILDAWITGRIESTKVKVEKIKDEVLKEEAKSTVSNDQDVKEEKPKEKKVVVKKAVKTKAKATPVKTTTNKE